MTTTTAERPELLEGIITIHEAMRRDVVRLPDAIQRADEDAAWDLVRWFASSSVSRAITTTARTTSCGRCSSSGRRTSWSRSTSAKPITSCSIGR